MAGTTPSQGIPYAERPDPFELTADLRGSFNKIDSVFAQTRGESAAALTTGQAAEALAEQALSRAQSIEEPIHIGPAEPTNGEELWVDTDADNGEGAQVSAADISDATAVGRNVLTAPLAINARNALDIWTGTRALLDAGTDTAERTWDAAELAGYVTDQVAAGGGAASPARSSTTQIACIGDSLTDGYSDGAAWDEADSYPAQLGAWLGAGYTVTNLGFSGATTDQINLRLGAQPLHMRVTGGQIPASGPVTLTSDQVIGGWGGPTDFNAYGYLAGIYGILQYTSAGGYTFTRSGSGDPITTTTAVFEGEFRDHATDTLVYMAGRNDITKGTQGMESTIVDHMMRGYVDVMRYPTPRRAQVALCGTITRTDETPGSPGFHAVQELSTRLRLLYPGNVIDVQGYLIGADVWTHTGITPTTDDLAAQSQGMTPPGLFDDVTHYSRATAKAIAEHLIGPWLKAKGWV